MDKMVPAYVAHVTEDESGMRYESVVEHLTEVAEMASRFAGKFESSDLAYAAGVLHDVGKYSREFQRRILQNGPRIDHSTAGAYVAASTCNVLLAYCIAGHHGGLPDGGVPGDVETTLCGRIYKAQNRLIPDYSVYQKEIPLLSSVSSTLIEVDKSRIKDSGYRSSLLFSQAFFTRMLYSCLVDADYLCTERFMNGRDRESAPYVSLGDLCKKLEDRLEAFYPPKTHLNRIRCNVLDDCKRMAASEPGVFSLTVPTGGGKTYALMRFALHHAIIPGRKFDRVICAEPYTSIIEQNAEVYRQVFGEEFVLEHHSNYDFEDPNRGDDPLTNPMRLAAENWDAPVVVTTNVQLFESLFANKASRCRKLHNIARSVIVLDEAQMIPVRYLLPCVKALSELVKHYGCTVVLCTATQPALSSYFAEEGLDVTEIASNPKQLVSDLRRVTYASLGRQGDEELTQRVVQHSQALCIVNSRKQARALYDLLLAEAPERRDSVFHLSTLMYPLHRMKTIDAIRHRIKAGLPCTVVSTSLVEAGVDLDFDTVYRAVAGIDSMVQAAGRCNRENRRPVKDSVVYLFEPATTYSNPQGITQCAEVARSVVPQLRTESSAVTLDSLDVISQFFSELHSVKSPDDKEVVKELSQYKSFNGIPLIPFAKVAAKFRLVENGSFAVVVPTRENGKDIDLLVSGCAGRGALRRLSRSSVNVYKNDRDALLRTGIIEPVGQDIFLLLDDSRYMEDIGLDLYAEGGEAVFL